MFATYHSSMLVNNFTTRKTTIMTYYQENTAAYHFKNSMNNKIEE